MSITYMSFGWKLKLTPTELLVYLAIADHVDDDGEGCYASYDKLVDKTGLSKSTVIRTCQRLEDAGILVHQGTHPKFGTNVWSIDKGKLPFKKSGKKGLKEDLKPIPRLFPRKQQVPLEYLGEECHGDTSRGVTMTPPEYHSDTPGGVTVIPNPSVESLVEPSVNHTSAETAADVEFERVLLDESGEEIFKHPDEPETALQTKIAQLTHSRYLSASTKARLRDGVTAAWGDNKRPVTHPSPEDEWAAHPELFAEYVELCARRIREESGRPPSRDKLVQSVRNYARYNTGWLDFRKSAQEEKRQAQQRAHPSAKQNQWYYDPSKPDWMQ